MPRLVSLLCKGCLLRFETPSLFDDDQKRSCYGKCHHSLCLQCVSRDPEQDCPICGEPKAFEHKTIDYAASRVYEDLLNRPIDIFKDWWSGETLDIGRCALCLEEVRDLRLCVDCEMNLPKGERCIAESNKKYEFKVNVHSRLPDFFDRVFCSDCLIDRHEEIEERNIARQKKLLKWMTSLKPEDFEVHKPKKNGMWKLKDLEQYGEVMKRITLEIADGLLRRFLNKMKEKEFCKLRFWKLFRTFEVLMFFSYSLCRHAGVEAGGIFHGFEWYPNLSKFFIGFKNVDTSASSKEIVEKYMKSLEVQLEDIKKIQTKCECTEIYEKMHKWKCGNSVDQIFVKMVESVDLEDVSVLECLLRRDSRLYEEIQKCYKKAEKMFQWKLHLIPTVVCWSKSVISDGHCCLFDDKNKKPFECSECENLVCAECWKDGTMKCPVCENLIHSHSEIWRIRCKYTANTEIIELVNFYKKSCVDLYEKWWNSEPVPFCLKCNSYSTQLEICVFCEEPSSLKCNAHHNADFQFKNVRLTNLPFRIQCSHCPIRLQSDWRYRNCEKAQESSQLSFRGCNHPQSRLPYQLCRVNKFTSQEDPFNAVALNSIENFKYAWKLATIKILHQILRSAVEDMDTCQLRKLRFMKIVGKLKNQTYKLLNLGIRGKLENEKKHLEGIQNTIDILKFQWAELQGGHENCRCKELWNRESSKEQLEELFKTATSFQLDQKLGGCPLEFNHGFKTSEDDLYLEFQNLWTE